MKVSVIGRYEVANLAEAKHFISKSIFDIRIVPLKSELMRPKAALLTDEDVL